MESPGRLEQVTGKKRRLGLRKPRAMPGVVFGETVLTFPLFAMEEISLVFELSRVSRPSYAASVVLIFSLSVPDAFPFASIRLTGAF